MKMVRRAYRVNEQAVLGKERGSVLITAMLVSVLLAMLGGVAMNFAGSEAQMAGRHREEAAGRLLAEGGVEQVIAWLTHADRASTVGRAIVQAGATDGAGLRFSGTTTTPVIDYDARRAEDDRLLNDPQTGAFRALAGLGRIARLRLYGPAHAEDCCTVEVTGESENKVQRTVALVLSATRIPPVHSAIQGGTPGDAQESDGGETERGPLLWVHWGALRLAGNPFLGRSGHFPRKSGSADVTGLGYGEAGISLEDRWVEAWIGGTPRFEDADALLPPNLQAQQDPSPGLLPVAWEYQRVKALARRLGTYYVPDREGRLYRDGVMDPQRAQTPAQVFGSSTGGAQRGLVFIDTLDQTPPSADNLARLVLDVPYMEGTFYVNAHVVLQPEGQGQAVAALSPPLGSEPASRVPVAIADVRLQGVLQVAGRLQIDRAVRVWGAVIAEQGLTGEGLLEVWYDYDLSQGLVRGLPVVFPTPGTWREWGN